MSTRFTTVAAGVLRGQEGRWLMHRRPADKHHGGLWEFPGGKVEAAEMPVEALVRELAEELGITCLRKDCHPEGFAESAPGEAGRRLVILLYSVSAWEGEPRALEGGAIDWFTPAEVDALPKPPLDIALAAGLRRNR